MISELEKLNIKVPAKIAAANAVRSAVMRHASAWAPTDDVSALAEKIKAGQLNPAEADAEMLTVGNAMVRRNALLTIAQTMANACDIADAAALRASGDELVAALRPKVESLGVTLADMTANVGAHPTQDVAALGPRATANYTQWVEANSTLQTIRSIVSPLFVRGGVMSPLSWVVLDDIDADAWARLDQCGTDFAEMTAAGFVITLNTPETVKSKIAELARVRV